MAPNVSPDLYARADKLAGQQSYVERGYQDWLKNQGPAVAATTSEETMPQGRVRRGPRGELLLTNLADAGKELAYNDPGTMAPETLQFQPNLRTGQAGFSLMVNPTGGAVANRGMAGFSPGAPDPTETSWDEVRTNPAYSQLQKEHWIEANQAGLPLSLIQAQIGEAAAQAELNRKQAGVFEEQAGALRRQPPPQTSLDRLMEQTIILLEQDVERQAKINPVVASRLDALQLEELQKLLVTQGKLKPGMPIPEGYKNQVLEDAARSEAVRRYVMERMTPIQERLAQQGVTP